MIFARYAVVMVLAALGTQPARAHCELESFDQGSPPALVGEVETLEEEFVWASDYDERDGIAWVWNYLKNTHKTKPLAAEWLKANINISYANPLPPNYAYCNKYPVLGLTPDDIDDDAPINYGNANRVQRAAVYRRKVAEGARNTTYISEISSAYVDNDGEIKDVEVSVFYTLKGNDVVDIGILAPEDVYIGIAKADEIWSPSTFDSLNLASNEYGAQAAVKSWNAFGSPDNNAITSISPGIELSDVAAFTMGTVKGWGYGEISTEQKVTEVILFDDNKKPILTGLITLPVTKESDR